MKNLRVKAINSKDETQHRSLENKSKKIEGLLNFIFAHTINCKMKHQH